MRQEEAEENADVGKVTTLAQATSWREEDLERWEEIYRDLYPRLRSFFIRRVGVQDADDAVAETVARAISGIDRYRPGPAGLSGWVFGIARHVACDQARRQAKKRPTAFECNSTSSLAPQDLSDGPLLDAEHRLVRRAFGHLSPRDQEVLELRVIAGLSVVQAAAVLGKRPGAIRMRQSRALSNLRRLLELFDD